MKKGAEFLRDCVQWLDARPEHMNDGKDHGKLIREWMKATSPDPNHYK